MCVCMQPHQPPLPHTITIVAMTLMCWCNLENWHKRKSISPEALPLDLRPFIAFPLCVNSQRTVEEFKPKNPPIVECSGEDNSTNVLTASTWFSFGGLRRKLAAFYQGFDKGFLRLDGRKGGRHPVLFSRRRFSLVEISFSLSGKEANLRQTKLDWRAMVFRRWVPRR